MTPYSVLIEIKLVRNYVISNFKLYDQLFKYTVFTPRVLKLAKLSHFAEKIGFWSTLDVPIEKTVHLQEWVMIVKNVVNTIVDIIHFYQNTLRSNLKELWEI